GMNREPTSFPDLIQLIQRREGIRVFAPVLSGDSLALIPAESLSVIPKDSMRALQRASRRVARAWGDRWIAAAADQAAPRQLMTMLLALDRDYAGALKELAAAESIGIQTPAWSPAARRLVILGKSGNIAGASRIADSLANGGFFANMNNLAASSDAAIWSFALNLARGRASAAQVLLEQQAALRRAVAPGAPNPEFTALLTLMGNQDPEDEPHITRQFRGRQLDSLLAHLADFVAAPQLGPWLPMILSVLADVADTTNKRSADLLVAADSLAKRGQNFLAFSTASNAVTNDTMLEPKAAGFAWYRGPAEAYNAVKRSAAARMRPGSATVSERQAVFEWKVDDSAPFALDRAESPAGRVEYSWEVNVDLGTRYYRMTTNSQAKSAVAAPRAVLLGDVLPPTANRSVFGGASAAGVQKDTTRLLNVTLRTEIAPGVLRMIVNDPVVVESLRRARPAQARFRFFPCAVPVGTVGRRECLDERIAITYSP
ncbi:MAG: hypothetical protein ACREMI_03405, partial [Gemmatimonadales bacterium]